MPDRYSTGKVSARTRASRSDGQAVIHRPYLCAGWISGVPLWISRHVALFCQGHPPLQPPLGRRQVFSDTGCTQRLKMRVGCSRGGDIGCCCCISHPWNYVFRRTLQW
uniref:Uncharacterized protein n=1 Tax=Hyaloperonospora arabidopsidis (strain Emoy2) TaxID=559515 RepID=M4C2Q1_HYAAE